MNPEEPVAHQRSVREDLINGLGNALLRPPVGGLGQVPTHGSRTARQIAVTFDDGPSVPVTDEILDVLSAHGVTGTFFCVGVNAQRYPETVARAHREGHIIGNHSMLHSRKSGLLPSGGAHIDDCEQALEDIIGVRPRLYRAPWGWVTPWELRRLKSRGYSVVNWDVDTYDWRIPCPDAERIAAAAAGPARPGSILLFHDGIAGWWGHDARDRVSKPQMVRGLDRAIVRLQAEGFEFVPLHALLEVAPYADAPSEVLGGDKPHEDDGES